MLTPGAFDDEYGKPSEYEKSVKRLMMPTVRCIYAVGQTKRHYSPPGLDILAPTNQAYSRSILNSMNFLFIAHRESTQIYLERLRPLPQERGAMFQKCSGNSWLQTTSGEHAPDKDCAELYGRV